MGLRRTNHGLTLIVSFFSFVQTSFREFGGEGFGHVRLGYIRFSTKLVGGPWLRGDSALGPPV